MNPLQTEIQRLYAAPEGQVRALVLELARPADLALPAPAIAVTGVDGYQLWLSLVEPVPVAEAAVFLEALRQHYLGAVAPKRISLLPSLADTAVQPSPVPSQQSANGYWSAFVAPDLAPIFADDPWLDQAPALTLRPMCWRGFSPSNPPPWRPPWPACCRLPCPSSQPCCQVLRRRTRRPTRPLTTAKH
jgi:hypothetical protein